MLCIAVSTTSEATGTYNRYSYGFGRTRPDYPKYAVWPNAYYASVNAFGSGPAEPCAFDRNGMLAGKSKVAMICFTPNNNNFSFLPSDLDGAALPSTGAPNHYVELGTTNTLEEYDFHVDFAHPKKSTFTGPTPFRCRRFLSLAAAATAFLSHLQENQWSRWAIVCCSAFPIGISATTNPWS
jgi:hypothetical protein